MTDFVRFSSGSARRDRGGGGGGGRRNSWNQHRGRRGRGGGSRGRGHGSGRGRSGGRQQQRSYQDYAADEIEEFGTPSDDTLCIAVQGCCHGELDAIYDSLKRHEETTGRKVDLLLCCGDFQSLRSAVDYHSFAVPPKYRTLGSFHRYYTGEKKAPVLTVFIGGNHEASQPLSELYYGGWVAPNMYYLGAAGVVNVAGIRIGGISGIYKSHDFTQGRFERPPYDRSSLRSVYHVRNIDVYRLKCLSPESRRLDIMLSHDWPQGIEQHGDTDKLLRQKPFFREEVQRNELGSPPNRDLLDSLKPKWWFSAHLHVKFKAQVDHVPPTIRGSDSVAASLVPSQVRYTDTDHAEATGNGKVETTENEPTVTTHFQSLESSKTCNTRDLTDMMTEFLALDKCLPRRQHLSILHIPCHGRKDVIEYDPEWLAVLQKTHHLTCAERKRVHCPREPVHVSSEEIDALRMQLTERYLETETPLGIPHSFQRTLPHTSSGVDAAPLPMMGNPQTDDLLNLLGLEHKITIPYSNEPRSIAASSIPGPMPCGTQDVDEIQLDDDDEVQIFLDYEGAPSNSTPLVAAADDNEIELDEEADEAPSSPNDDEDDVSPALKRARANS